MIALLSSRVLRPNDKSLPKIGHLGYHVCKFVVDVQLNWPMIDNDFHDKLVEAIRRSWYARDDADGCSQAFDIIACLCNTLQLTCLL